MPNNISSTQKVSTVPEMGMVGANQSAIATYKRLRGIVGGGGGREKQEQKERKTHS